MLNSTKAGQAVPLKWRVLDAGGAPVTTLTSAVITASSLVCATGAGTDELEELAPGASALKNLGNGDYQLNWKTPSSYAGKLQDAEARHRRRRHPHSPVPVPIGRLAMPSARMTRGGRHRGAPADAPPAGFPEDS